MYIKKDLNTILFVFCIISIIIGILCIAFANALAVAIPYIIGALVIIDGIYILIKYFVRKDIEFPNNFALAQGLINVVLGILIILSSEFFTKAFGIILGICLLVYGIFQLNLCINLKKLIKSYIYDLIESLLLIIFAIILLIFSSSAMKIIITILGVGMIVLALFVIVKIILQNKKNMTLEGEIIETNIAEDNEENDKK